MVGRTSGAQVLLRGSVYMHHYRKTNPQKYEHFNLFHIHHHYAAMIPVWHAFRKASTGERKASDVALTWSVW